MAEKTADNAKKRNYDVIIIAITIVLLVLIFMYFWDRQQAREARLEKTDTRMDVLEEWGRPQQNRQMNNNAAESGGKIL